MEGYDFMFDFFQSFFRIFAYFPGDFFGNLLNNISGFLPVTVKADTNGDFIPNVRKAFCIIRNRSG